MRAIIDEIERANTVAHGYGGTVFLRTLGDCFARLDGRAATAAERAEIDALAHALVGRSS